MSLPEPYYEDPASGIVIYCGDCRAILPALDAERIDLMLTDPPYGISGQQEEAVIEMSGRRDFKRQFGDWDMEWDPTQLLAQACRLLRAGGSLVAFLAHGWIPAYMDTPLQEKKLGVWAKTNPPPRVRPGYQAATEFWTWQVKPGASPVWNGGFLQSNVLYAPILGGAERGEHPTQKPLSMIKGFMERHSDPGETILDPFMGSGTTLVAAKTLGRKAIGIELEAKWCEVAKRRLLNTEYKPRLLEYEPWTGKQPRMEALS